MSGSITNNGSIIGSGSDTITVLMSQDPDGPAGAPGTDGAFTLNVDGQQIGGIQDISAIQANGQQEAFTFAGNFAPGQHTVTITFTNNNGTPGDSSNVGDSGDRNIYVDGVSYDGQTVSSTTTPIYQSPGDPPNLAVVTPGNAQFTVNDATAIPAGAPSTPSTTPAAVNDGSGPDSLTLNMAEDPYMGDAQFTVSVDGQQVGGTFTTTAVQYEGQQQAFNLSGNWGSGAHTVTVDYLSDTIGAVNSQGLAYDNQDQNLYVKSISYDGLQASGAPYELANDGPVNFSVPAGGQPGTSSTATTSDTAAVTTNTLAAGSPSSSSSTGMSFLPSPTTATTSASTATTAAAPAPTVSTPSDWTPPSSAGWTGSSGQFAGAGQWWMAHHANAAQPGIYAHS